MGRLTPEDVSCQVFVTALRHTYFTCSSPFCSGYVVSYFALPVVLTRIIYVALIFWWSKYNRMRKLYWTAEILS